MTKRTRTKNLEPSVVAQFRQAYEADEPDVLPIYADYLEDHGDPRADAVRELIGLPKRSPRRYASYDLPVYSWAVKDHYDNQYEEAYTHVLPRGLFDLLEKMYMGNSEGEVGMYSDYRSEEEANEDFL